MQDLQLFKHDLWIQANFNNKVHVYGFDTEELVMKQHARLSVFTRSSSFVNNYNAQGEARAEDMRKKIEVRNR